MWPQCSQTNRRVRTGRILSNYKSDRWFFAKREPSYDVWIRTRHKIHGHRNVTRTFRLDDISFTRKHRTLAVPLHIALEECLKTNRVTEFSIRSLLLSSLVLRDTRGERYLVRSKVYETEGAIFRSLRSEVSPLTTRSALLCHRTTRNVSIAKQLQQSKCYDMPQPQNRLLRLYNPE